MCFIFRASRVETPQTGVVSIMQIIDGKKIAVCMKSQEATSCSIQIAVTSNTEYASESTRKSCNWMVGVTNKINKI